MEAVIGFIASERLLLRPFQESDFADTFAIYRQAEVCRFLLHEPWRTKQVFLWQYYTIKRSSAICRCGLLVSRLPLKSAMPSIRHLADKGLLKKH